MSWFGASGWYEGRVVGNLNKGGAGVKNGDDVWLVVRTLG
jgi:hypothetical protein